MERNEQNDAMRDGAVQAAKLWQQAFHNVSIWYFIGFFTAIIKLIAKRDGNIIAHVVMNAISKAAVEND